MNKKILMLGAIMALISLAVFVSAYYDSTNQKIVIPINKGWNLVPLFSWELDTDSPIKMNDLQHGYFYSRDLGEYVLLFEGNWNHNMDEAVFKNEGESYAVFSSIWVYSNKQGNLELEWGNFQQSTLSLSNPNIELKMKSGWNFIFITSDMIDYSLNEIKGSCDYERIYTYAKEGGTVGWMDLLNNPNFMDEGLTDNSVGYGLVIKVFDDCTLGYNEEGTTPPALP